MLIKIIKSFIASTIFAGVIATSVQVQFHFEQNTKPELRIQANAEDMVLEVTTTTTYSSDGSNVRDRTFILPFVGATNVVVDWGNGDIQTIITGGEFSKLYVNTGTYQVKITGSITGYGYGATQFINQRDPNALLRKVIQWGDTGVSSLRGAFLGANNLIYLPETLPETVTDLSYLFNQKTTWTNPLSVISNWDISRVTNLQNAFYSATNFNTDISSWDTSSVTNMSNMFYGAQIFNQDLSKWDVSKVTNFASMFERAFVFNGNISSWIMSSAKDLGLMFYLAFAFNQNLSSWDVSNVTNFSRTFHYAEKFNGAIGNWNVSSGTNFSQMFEQAIVFNQNINSWDVSNATNMAGMFRSARAFNSPLSDWKVSNVTSMFGMFEGATVFNQNINTWDVSKVTSFGSMFNNARDFNQPLNHWNVSLSTNFSSMFRLTSFDQDISLWNVSSGTQFGSMFFSNAKFNQPLNDWNMANAVIISQMFEGASSFNQPLNNWNVSNVTDMAAVFRGAVVFNQDLGSWNTSKVTSMFGMFDNAKKFNQNISTWDVSKVTQFGNMFASTDDFNQPIGVWNTSSATSMASMFSNAKAFSAYIGEWDVSKVVNFSSMFNGANAFNQDISGWTTGAATNMASMFANNTIFNQEISEWDTSKVTSFESMFQNSIFNQSIGSWKTASGTNMYRMFRGNAVFNQPIGDWDVTKVNQMAEMFYQASAFNQDLPWTTTAVTSLFSMFAFASDFDGDISTWDVSKVTSFNEMFWNATDFNQPLNSWNMSAATSIYRMFRFASSFNQPLNNWNTGNVTNMERVFENATSFSQNLGSWDFSKVTTMQDFMGGSVNLNPLHYDAILQRLTDQTVPLNIFGGRQISFGQSKYSKVAKALKDALIASRTWSISDGGQLNLVIKVDNNEKYFGEDDPVFTVSYTGLVTGAGEDTFNTNFIFTRTPGETVGTYTVSVTGGDESYYYVTYQTGTFSILKPEIDVSEVSWDYDSPFVYTGSAFTVTLMNVPELITVTYTGNTATNAGTYTASITITYDIENYELVGEIDPLTWIIEKATHDLTEVDWDYSNVFTYNGTQRTVLVTGLPTGVTVVSYSGNTATNAGTYTATVTINYDEDNYVLLGSIDALTWIIEKANYDMSGVTWTYTEAFDYDMTEKTVLLIGLPTGVTVAAYTGNQATQPGFYTASVGFNYDVVNFNTPTIDDLDWEIFAQTFTITFDTKGGSTIQSISGIFGSSVTPPSNPTRPGYSFNGWNRSIPSTMPNENMTITASWLLVNTSSNTDTDLSGVIDLSEFEGEDIDISLIITLLNKEDLTEEEASILSAFISKNIGNNVEQLIYDIRLIVGTTGGQVSIQETTTGFTITILLPEELTAGTFYVIQYLDGVAIIIESQYDTSSRSISFNVSKLGTYVIAYQTNQFSPFAFAAISAGGLGLLGLIWFIFFGRRRKTKEEVVVEEDVESSMEDKPFFTKDFVIKGDFYQTLSASEKIEFNQYFVEDTLNHLAKDLIFIIGEENKEFFKNVYKYVYRYRKLISLSLLTQLTNYIASLSEKDPNTLTLIYEAAIKTAYYRRKDESFLTLAMDLARKDIALQRNVLNPRGVFVYSFYRLSVILENQKQYAEALVLVNEGISRNLLDETKGGYVVRKRRLLTKK